MFSMYKKFVGILIFLDPGLPKNLLNKTLDFREIGILKDGDNSFTALLDKIGHLSTDFERQPYRIKF